MNYLPNITIDGSASPGPLAYELAVHQVLESIRATKSGRGLLSECYQNGHQLVIAPTAADPSATGPGAHADSWKASEPFGAPLTGPGGKQSRIVDPATGQVIVGAGGGSDVHLWFDPYLDYGSPHVKDDDVLFHELVHALRDMMGLYLPSAMGNHVDDTEEFHAILCANIYLSEKGRAGDLRAAHQKRFVPLDDDLKDSKAFLEFTDDSGVSYRDLVRKLHMQLPGLTDHLSNVDADKCRFNPVREWLNQYRKFWSVSNLYGPAYLDLLGSSGN
jgi:hypothetical protein